MSTEDKSILWSFFEKSHRKENTLNFKRTINQNYFQWKWSYIDLLSAQMKFLLKISSIFTILRALKNLPPSEFWGRSNAKIYAFAVRLLWNYAQINDRLGITKLPEPEMGNPYPVMWEGRLISQDLANTSLELNWLVEQLKDASVSSVVEIGAGYGRMAYAFISFLKNEYHIVDIEPTRSISEKYLSSLGLAVQYGFPREADLAISISTFPEMTKKAQDNYIAKITESCKYVYFKQWTAWFNAFVPPLSWKPIKKEICPVQTNFTQAVFKIIV
ncbi:MAG: putative sugar O-methyltransferase [Patescibacteria group bacterium]